MKEVSENCFLQLYGQIIQTTLQDDPAILNVTLNNDRDLQATEVEEKKFKRDELMQRLEGLGFEVGYRFSERSAKDRPRMADPLEVIKFICKDFWISIFRKQIDKLQTNHRGVFVLQDFNFRWLANLSASSDDTTRELALLFLVFPCGFIRGALTNLGVSAIVNADVTSLPGCLFNIKLKE